MNVEQIAKQTGKSKKHIEFLFSRKRRASPELAIELEKLTGIERRAWIWPDEFHNPLIQQPESCAECVNHSTKPSMSCQDLASEG